MDMVHMHAQLVRPAGFGEKRNQRDAFMPFDHAIERDSVFGRVIVLDIPQVMMDRMPAQRRVDDAFVKLHLAFNQRDVLFFHFMLLELAGELRVRLVVLDRDHQPRGFLVQTVHDPRAQRRIKIRKLTAMEQKRVDQRPGIIPLRRMNEHAGRFIDDQQEFVFVKNIQGDILGGNRVRVQKFGRDVHVDIIARVYFIMGLGLLFIHEDGPGLQKFLDKAARGDIGERLRQIDVQAFTIVFGFDF